MPITQNMLADAASTLAHLWAAGDDAMNRTGVERVLLTYPAATQRAITPMIWRYLEDRHSSADAQSFFELLCELAGVSCDEG